MQSELSKSLGFDPHKGSRSVFEEMQGYPHDEATIRRREMENLKVLMAKLTQLNLEREALLAQPQSHVKSELILCMDSIIQTVRCEILIKKERLEQPTKQEA